MDNDIRELCRNASLNEFFFLQFYAFQDPALKVAEFMATNPVLTEIEARIKHYQVTKNFSKGELESASGSSRLLDFHGF